MLSAVTVAVFPDNPKILKAIFCHCDFVLRPIASYAFEVSAKDFFTFYETPPSSDLDCACYLGQEKSQREKFICQVSLIYLALASL